MVAASPNDLPASNSAKAEAGKKAGLGRESKAYLPQFGSSTQSYAPCLLHGERIFGIAEPP